MQARTDAEIKLLQNLKLQTLTDARDLPASSNENHLLRGCMHLINDRRLQLRLVPASAATAQLRKVLRAAARAPAATQSGMAAYALLSPVAHALEDVQLLARGNKAHMARALKDKADTLVHAGEHLWKRSLRVGAKQQGAARAVCPSSCPRQRLCLLRSAASHWCTDCTRPPVAFPSVVRGI